MLYDSHVWRCDRLQIWFPKVFSEATVFHIPSPLILKHASKVEGIEDDNCGIIPTLWPNWFTLLLMLSP